MLFSVNGVLLTNVQLEAMLDADGVFFSAYTVESSNLYTPQYRSGDAPTRRQVEALMALGTANNLRYLADVDADRVLSVFEQADSDTATLYRLRQDGVLYDANNLPLAPVTCPVGVWFEYDALLPLTANVSALSFSTLAFVEEAEFDVETGQWAPITRTKELLNNVNTIAVG
jgi:hypothetical protein